MEDKIFDELPAYIESTPLIQIESNDVVGVRTEKYKYFRDSDDSQKRIHLYDLKADPYEDSNVHENNPKIILEMEQILSSFTKRIDTSNDEFSEEETEMIEDELRKMGYV